MELTIEYNPELHIVETVATGIINTENIAEASHRILEVSGEYNCNNLLVDLTSCQVTRSKMEGFLDMEKFMELTGMGYEYRCAVVYSPDTYPEDRAEFIETVVRNRPNPRFRMFSRRSDSLQWLRDNQDGLTA
jgi:hypothetical protein